MNKIETKFKNVRLALSRLKIFLSECSGREIEKAGVLQAFEFTYEVFWQFFKVCAEEAGRTSILGPRDAFKFAFASGFIDDEELWLAMIPQRNDTVHSYNSAVAQRVFSRVKTEFVAAFERSEHLVAARLNL